LLGTGGFSKRLTYGVKSVGHWSKWVLRARRRSRREREFIALFWIDFHLTFHFIFLCQIY